ncbi:MAG TPA: Na+/H+ antiporter NhaA [Actinomycetota bacterium]|nr:Na+/H+ antiporter NhaA [Actinomycetota bacterium]
MPIREFIATENASAVVLLAATLGSLLWANSPWGSSYEQLWSTELSFRFGEAELSLDLRHWINDGLMAFFFFVAGLEIRREFDMGELRERRRVATAVLAAVGGLVAPALIYLAFNAGQPTARGWGIPIGTDTAFALGILALVGRRSPAQLRVFLLTLVIVDDIGALSVVALAYTGEISPPALLLAVALFGVVLVLRRAGVRHGVAYFVVGLGVWLSMLASGLHPTIAGVALGLLATAHPPAREDLQRAGALWRLFREQPTPELARSARRGVAVAISSNERLQHLFHPWTSYVIVPLFALANAGVQISGDALTQAVSSPIALGIVCGLVGGKIIGITGATWLATRPVLGGFPMTLPWPPLVGAATVAGIGFTVSLLIADITFQGQDLEEAKLGILAASTLAAALAWVVFRVIEHLPRATGAPEQTRLAEPLTDLVDPVDPELDHVRGPEDAGVTLVEYGDFECPYCGQAESVIRELLAKFGTELRFVFRHLPLVEVHEHAELAAEAAEAAHAQGKFWQMYDLLFMHQDALGSEDMTRYAAELGLETGRFSEELSSGTYASRVARDVESADQSGVAGTPTFFINGRRHYGAYDLGTFTSSVEQEARAVIRHPPDRTP